jgi:hypothetical protein
MTRLFVDGFLARQRKAPVDETSGIWHLMGRDTVQRSVAFDPARPWPSRSVKAWFTSTENRSFRWPGSSSKAA